MFRRSACAMSFCLLWTSVDASAADAVDVAARLIGRPYVWGAEGPNSFDCSGLTQFVYQELGVDLPRRAISQSKVGDLVRKRLQRGDLLFFSTDPRKSLVTHVGIYEGAGMMIDASQRQGRVGRDNLDDEFWADRFMFARRLPFARSGGGSADRQTGGDDVKRPTPPGRGRQAALEAIGRIAGILLRPPRR
jgi:hypothetical protein